MEIWQEIRKNGENGAKKLVSDYGNRLFAAAILLCADEHEAEELVFRTFDRVIKKIRQYQLDICNHAQFPPDGSAQKAFGYSAGRNAEGYP